MRSKTQSLIFRVAVFSSSLLISGLISAQKKVTTHPAKPGPAAVRVSGRSEPRGNIVEEQEHCFKAAPRSALVLTISSADTDRPLPKGGVVTVEIINEALLNAASSDSLTKPNISPVMKYELAAARIKDGQAKVTFKGDANASVGPGNTTIHLGSNDPMDGPGTPYSNVALITISSPMNPPDAAEPVKYVYAYHVWTKDPSECKQKP